MVTQLPVFDSHADAANFYITYWQGADDGSSNLLKTGLRYQGVDGREYRSVAATTAEESWVDANQWKDLVGLADGFREQLATLLTTDADGISAINGMSINAALLNGQTAQQIIDAARTRQRVHNVEFLLNPNTDPVPGDTGVTWATTAAGNGLTALTLYRRLATGANSVVDNLIPGDYVLAANGAEADVAYIVKTEPDSGNLILAPVGEDELSPPELQLVQLLKSFGGDRITTLLTALETFGTENLHNEADINTLIAAQVNPLTLSMAALVNFGIQRAVDLLTALEAFGAGNLISINDVAMWYAERNLTINFHPKKGSSDPSHPNYNTPLQAPYADMSVHAIPDGHDFGFYFRNVGVAADTKWIRTVG